MLSGFPVYMIGEPFLKKSGSHSEKDGLVLSKKEGGEWALDNISASYHSLLRKAMKGVLR